MVLPKAIAIISLAVATCGCTSHVSEYEKKRDIKEIIENVFSNELLFHFLDQSKPNPYTFRYEELPVYNGQHLMKPQFNIALKNGRIVEYNTRMKDEINSTTIIIERIIIDHDSATINLRIPKQGVIGKFQLRKKDANKWIIMKNFVVET